MKKTRKTIVMLSVVLALVFASSISASATVENVGGGQWNHGMQSSPRQVWSNYVNNTLYHSATSICGSKNNKVFANAKLWANSSATGSDTRYAYWATY